MFNPFPTGTAMTFNRKRREPREWWRLSRCDNRAIAGGATTGSASSTSGNCQFAYSEYLAVDPARPKPAGEWIERFEEWLADSGFLKKP